MKHFSWQVDLYGRGVDCHAGARRLWRRRRGAYAHAHQDAGRRRRGAACRHADARYRPPHRRATRQHRQPAASQRSEPAAQPTPTPVVERIATVATDLLNIRSDPSTSGNILQTRRQPARPLPSLGQSDDGQWLQLAKDGTTIGWAAAEFLTVEERVAAGAGRRRAGDAGRRQPGAAAPRPPARLLSCPRP